MAVFRVVFRVIFDPKIEGALPRSFQSLPKVFLTPTSLAYRIGV